MTLNKKCILIMIHLIFCISLFSTQMNQSETYYSNDSISVLPHHLSENERPLMQNWGNDRILSTPPLAPVRPVAEFEPLTSVLVRYPLGFPVSIIKQFAEELTVVTIVSSESVKNQAITAYNNAQVNMDNCKFMIGATNSYWTRDYGPWFAFDGNDQLSVIDFTYNRPRPLDDALIPIYAAWDTLSCYTMTIQQTGGNYMTDGIGIAASTQIAYTENGNNETNVNQQMLNYLGVSDYQVIQDPNNTYIDHIDCWGKFLAPDKVLIRSVPSSHAQYDEIEEVAEYFSNLMSSYNRPFRVYRIYTPNNQPYTNSVILNNRVFVPIMNNTNDAAALQTYRDAMPGYTVIGVTNNTSNPWESTDALHCRTHEIPDRRMLYIAHTPLNWEQNIQESYAIDVTIKSLSNGNLISDSTKVFYKINQSNYSSADLNLIENNQYRAIIPAPAPGDTVYYYVKALDSNSKKAFHPFIGQPDPHYFVIADDNIAPQITHSPITSIAMNDMPININATITDNASVNMASVEYYTNTNSEVTSSAMTEINENEWSVAIDPNHENLSTIYYRIKASDQMNTAYFPADSSWLATNITNTNDHNDLPVINDSFISVYPNPINFNQSKMNLKFSTNNNKQVKFEIYNVKGQKVHEFTQFNRAKNDANIQIDLNHASLKKLNSGIYFIKMITNEYSVSKKIVIIK